MKKISRSTFLTAVPLALLTLPASAQPTNSTLRIAIIDLRKVFEGYYKTKAANATLKERTTDLDKELKALTDQYQKTTDDYKKALDNANNQAVSADERDKSKKTAETKFLEIKELEQSIEQFRRQAAATLGEQERRMRDNILGEIRNVINGKAKAGSFSLVLDVAAETINKTPAVLYSNGENDISDAVLKDLNAAAPPDALKADDKKDAK